MSGIPDCLLPGNPILFEPSMQVEICIDHITGDIYTYDQDKLFISMGDLHRSVYRSRSRTVSK